MPAGTGTEEPHQTRGWDPFWLRPLPALFLLRPAEAAKVSRVFSMPKDLQITSGKRVSGTQYQLQRIVEGLVTPGTGKKEPRRTRGWDPFQSGPALPSSK